MSSQARRTVNTLKNFQVKFAQRKSLHQLNFTSGTTTWKECLIVMWSIIKMESLQKGNWIGIFERDITNLLGVRHVFTFSAGRMALYSILKALDIGEGDEVILPGYTCVVVPAAIIYAGARPVYIDISRRDYNLDADKIEAKITDKTRAIIAQHTYGIPCNLDAIKEICDRYKLFLIEDCAHLLGTSHKGKKLGTIGDVAFFSTDHTKFISTSVGGITVTNNDLVGQKLKNIYEDSPFLNKRDILKILSQFIIVNILYHPSIYFIGKYFSQVYNRLGWTFFMDNYDEIKKPSSYPYPARMSNLQAKIGCSQVKNLRKNLQHRNNIVKMYDKMLGVSTSSDFNALLRYPLEVTNREDWIKNLSPVLEVESWFDSPAQGKRRNLWEIRYRDGECPTAEEVTRRIINLPTHLKAKPEDVRKIASLLDEKLLNGIVPKET